MNIQFEDIKIEEIINIAIKAGKRIMDIYEKDFLIEYKNDNSPLTQADKASNEIICNELKKLYKKIPLLSEENKYIEYSKRKDWEYFFCIDPLDGTKEFIKKNDEFTVNIALIHKNTPILGVVYAPALGDLYYAKKDMGAYKNNIKLPFFVNKNPKEKLLVVSSKSHLSKETEEFILQLDSNNIEHISIGSSLKLCMVAEGTADIYPRLAPTMEWDTAAADAIVREAGKMIYDYDSNSYLEYNKESLLNPWFVVK